MNYLGIPILTKALLRSEWEGLINKLKRRLEGWKNMVLEGGKANFSERGSHPYPNLYPILPLVSGVGYQEDRDDQEELFHGPEGGGEKAIFNQVEYNLHAQRHGWIGSSRSA